MSIESTLLEFSASKIEELHEQIESSIAKLTPEQVWLRGGENQNAIGNLLLHLNGNVRQWILSGVCSEASHRDRDAEFAARGNHDPKELLARFRATVTEAASRLRSLPHARLLDRLSIQGYEVTAGEAVLHVLEHFAGHSYQIFFFTKMLTGGDLGFYAHLSGTGTASTGNTRP